MKEGKGIKPLIVESHIDSLVGEYEQLVCGVSLGSSVILTDESKFEKFLWFLLHETRPETFRSEIFIHSEQFEKISKKHKEKLKTLLVLWKEIAEKRVRSPDQNKEKTEKEIEILLKISQLHSEFISFCA